MEITRRSMFSGVTRTRDLPVTERELADYEGGMLLQVAFPRLSAADREFIKTGITDEEWKILFPPDEEE